MRRRNHQKILKPEFYEKYRTERNNLELFDNAARYLAKKAVSSSLAHSEVGLGGEEGEDGRHAPWGGVVSKSVLASEVVPMLIKLQGMSKRESASPISVI
jgi:cell cycle checkpoint protein